MKRNYLSLLIVCLFALTNCSEKEAVSLKIIPKPQELQILKGHFQWNAQTNIIVENEIINPTAEWFADIIQRATGINPVISNGGHTASGNSLILSLAGADQSLVAEGYQLNIESKQITIRANEMAGIFYGLQSLLQIFPPEIMLADTKQVLPMSLPCVNIKDKPRFNYRGMHLDVSRTFEPKEFIKRYLDLLSTYKFNRFHWHLTDGGGWRLEIKKYPLLTQKTAFREGKTYVEFQRGGRRFVDEGTPDASGGYFTQEDVKEIVAYAAARNITVIPEIEMPGHSAEVFVAYPQLCCSGKPYTNGDFCAGNEEVFEFLDDVLSEVIELFPSEYIHIGGDEAGKAAWRTCPKCQKRMTIEQLKDVNELQSYFIKRVEKIVASKGRKIIGWDEILDGGLAPEATVMSWRGEQGGIAAARMEHNVIMTPEPYCYFDHYQADPSTQPYAISGYTPFKKVYHYDPIPASLEAQYHKYVLGAQANVWSEYIPNSQHVEYMVLPRMIALSEVLWSPKDIRDWESFKYRLDNQLNRLDYMNINHYQPSPYFIELITNVDIPNKRISIDFDTELYQPVIYYTTDGSMPTINSNRYRGTFHVTGSTQISAAIFMDGKIQEPILIKPVNYHLAVGKEIKYNAQWNQKYPANGEKTLVDGYRGGMSYNDGCWLGFTTTMDVVIDMGSVMPLKHFSATFMQLTGPQVYMPIEVEVFLSKDGNNFERALIIPNDVPTDNRQLTFKDFEGALDGKEAQYVKVIAKNDRNRFIFVDELIIE